jgi:16S rRNA (cytosine1402-N4)-methyltransferase
MHQNQNKHFTHVPVLLEAVLDQLQPSVGESYLDLTAGYGGHAAAIMERTKDPAQAVLVDRDQEAVEALQKRFGTGGTEIIHDDFYHASQQLLQAGRQFDLIVADLGLSSPHLDNASRGFSLKHDGPLDMRMDQSQELTAERIVNSYREAQLTDIIKRYGQDPKASRIAHLIVTQRPIKTTNELAAIVAKAWPGHSKVHPATRTFQALRIAVNNELELLSSSLPLWIELLKPGGRIGIISFHSLEDRLVKETLNDLSGERYDAELQLLTKRPVVGDRHELVSNPRARSAKLRAAVKINK